MGPDCCQWILMNNINLVHNETDNISLYEIEKETKPDLCICSPTEKSKGFQIHPNMIIMLAITSLDYHISYTRIIT